MSTDLSAAVEAAARAWRDENARRFPVFATEWDDLPATTRQNDLAVMTAALAAAAPLIEAQVRAQIAAEIEASRRVVASESQSIDARWQRGMIDAAEIARGESS